MDENSTVQWWTRTWRVEVAFNGERCLVSPKSHLPLDELVTLALTNDCDAIVLETADSMFDFDPFCEQEDVVLPVRRA